MPSDAPQTAGIRLADYIAITLLCGGRFISPPANRLEMRALRRARVFTALRFQLAERRLERRRRGSRRA